MTLYITNLYHKIGERTILEGISARLTQGSCVMITGHNGSGKSTLLKLIHKGHANITKKGVSVMMHQHINDNLFGALTVEENFHLIGAYDETWIQSMLGRFRSKPSPKTLVANLSGGERQRLALYMRVWMKPQFLLLDEFTSALDPQSSLELMEEVISLSCEHRVTTIIVTHDLDVLKNNTGYIHWEMEHGRLNVGAD